MISDCFNAARWHLRAAFTARSKKCEGSGGGTVLFGSKVGEGSFSDVFAAMERLPDGSTSRLAVKRVRLGGLPEADADACLLEATVMADLPPHPHLLATVGSVRRPSFVGPGEELLLLFELCPKGSLAEYLVGRRAWASPLDGDGVLAIFTQVCGGLAHLHAHGWAHCDVKPENLLLSATGWKLCDFGSVRDAPFRYVDGVTSPPELSEAEERIHRTSTPQYRPPEMYDLRAGEPVFTPADVWAVGVLLYALLLGRSLFGTAGEERLGCLGFEPAKQLSDEALGSLPSVGGQREALVSLLRAALTRSATARPTAAALLARCGGAGVALTRGRCGTASLAAVEARCLFASGGERRPVYFLASAGASGRRKSGVVCADQVCMDKEALRPVHAWACADLSFEAHSLQSLELSFWRRRRWAPHSLVGRATVPLEPDAACGAIGAAPWRPLQARGGGKELRVALTWTDSEKPASPPASIAAGTEEAPPADQPAAAEEPSWATF
mmetsp:Transcript_32527/g.104075  ORF Transcript_32527/g.104075 Transcript_32527/m.104075 type:complete len:498 (+) Transcript_32527:135-1628(+)